MRIKFSFFIITFIVLLASLQGMAFFAVSDTGHSMHVSCPFNSSSDCAGEIAGIIHHLSSVHNLLLGIIGDSISIFVLAFVLVLFVSYIGLSSVVNIVSGFIRQLLASNGIRIFYALKKRLKWIVLHNKRGTDALAWARALT